MITPQDEYQKKLKLFQEHLAAASRSAEMLERFHGKLIGLYPVKADQIENLEPDIEMTIYAFFKKYEQLVALMNDNILKNIPYFEMENMAKMSRYDTIVYAEKVGILESAKRFVDAVALRNQLTHEYPLDPGRQAALLNHAIVETEVLLQAMKQLHCYVIGRLPIWSEIRTNSRGGQ